jgi:hypothetical protein
VVTTTAYDTLFLKAEIVNELIDIMGCAVVQLVEALRNKPKVHGFDSRWCHWNFSLT